jgi:peptidase E
MRLVLTSDYPASADERVSRLLRASHPDPRIAWVSERTDAAAFATAREQFAALGFSNLEAVDIDEDLDQVQIAYLHEFDAVLVTAEDAVRLRYNALRSGLSGRLRQSAAAGALLLTAGWGGALLTPNVSLWRLQFEDAGAVIATRGRFDALGAVDYELLPHAARWDGAVEARVLEYSAAVEHDILAVADGGAVFHLDGAAETTGVAARYRKGQIIKP